MTATSRICTCSITRKKVHILGKLVNDISFEYIRHRGTACSFPTIFEFPVGCDATILTILGPRSSCSSMTTVIFQSTTDEWRNNGITWLPSWAGDTHFRLRDYGEPPVISFTWQLTGIVAAAEHRRNLMMGEGSVACRCPST